MERPYATSKPQAPATPAVAQLTERRPSVVRAFWRGMRPKHWAKNSFVLASFLFTMDQPGIMGRALPAFIATVCFCLVASAIYLVNDVCDAEADRLHPKKRHRPIAAGELSPRIALMGAGALVVAGVGGSVYLGGQFVLAVVGYVLLTISYSLWLKHIVIIDVMAVSAGFVIRAAAGAVAIGVSISPWLLICTTLIALLLSLAKRRAELAFVDTAEQHRRALEQYTVTMLDQMITIIAASTLMSYMLYTFLAAATTNRPALMLTIPLVVYGTLRFLFLAHRQEAGGIEEVLKDRGILLTVALWGLASAFILAFDRLLP